MLTDAAIFLLAAIVAVPLSRKLGLGAVLGYLGAGMVIGPAGLGLIDEVESVLHGAEIGVVFLLFVIGLELKPARLWLMRHSIFAMGSVQLLGAALPIALVAHYAFGVSWVTAGLIGFALALSSTAFVLQSLAENKKLASPQGRAAFGILLFQDLAVIPLLAIIPVLQGQGALGEAPGSGWLQVLFSLAAVVLFVLIGRALLKPVLRLVARWGSEESFTVAALLVVIGSALLLEFAELSMGLGAFLAGVLLADSEYRHELESNINPFKGLLLGLFFISVGMSADLKMIVQHPLLIVAGACGLIALKAFCLWIGARALGLPSSTAKPLALILAQGGEFAFVVFHAAGGTTLLDPTLSGQLIAMVILSMLLTPLLFFVAGQIEARSEQDKQRPYDTINDDEPRVIICGFGRVGQVIGRVLHARGIHFTALERDAEHVELVRRWGNKVYYGSSNNLETLRAAGAADAQLLVVAVDEVESSLRTVELVRRYYPQLPVIARARNRHHALHLREMGVEILARETWHSSLFLAKEVLRALGDSPENAGYTIEEFSRADAEILLRQQAHRHDQEHMIQTAREVRDELQELFENDPQLQPPQREPEGN